MKKTLLSLLLMFIGILLLTFSSISQSLDSKYGTDSALCILNAAIYRGFYDHKNYKEALTPWSNVLKICPKYSRNTYNHGVEMFKYRIKNESDIVKKEELIDSLMTIYDLRIKYFGSDPRYPEGWIFGQKAIAILKYRKEEVELVYELLTRSIELMGNKSKPPVILNHMKCSRQLFTMGLLSNEDVIEDFALTNDIAEYNLKIKPGDNYFTMAKNGIEQFFTLSMAADCDALFSLYGPKFNENPEDIDLIKKIIQLLTKTECTDSDLFTQATEALYNLEPSAGAANAIAKRFLHKEDYDKAIEYLGYAIEMESDPIEKATYYYSLGQVYYGVKADYIKARGYANEAIKSNSDYGEPYLLKGNIYIATYNKFSNDDFQNSTVFWVATDNFARAKAVDPKLTDEANRLINKYSPYFPPINEIFFRELEVGSIYTVGGWINERTIIRARK